MQRWEPYFDIEPRIVCCIHNRNREVNDENCSKKEVLSFMRGTHPSSQPQHEHQPSKHHHHEPWRVSAALILAQIFFGVGAVVGALGLPATHPLVFALCREFWAGLILLGISVCYLKQQQYQQDNKGEGRRPAAKTTTRSTTTTNNFLALEAAACSKKDESELATPTMAASSPVLYALTAWRHHVRSFALLGAVVFGNQAGFIVGIKLAGPVTASVWQPCQPIFTAAICMALGWEPLQSKRIAGILVAFCGCIVMVVLKSTSSTTSRHNNNNLETAAVLEEQSWHDSWVATHPTALRYVLGNALLCTNCLCTSLFVILSKRMLSLYPSLLVTAWSYNFATLFMGTATLLASTWPAAQGLLCPDCHVTTNQEYSIWYIPPGAWPALVYYVVFASVASYGLLTWANQYATGTLVMSFTVLQPVTATLLTTALLLAGTVPACTTITRTNNSTIFCLDYPSFGTFCGMGGVLLGLTMIVTTEATAKSGKHAQLYNNDHDEDDAQLVREEEKKDDHHEMTFLLSSSMDNKHDA